MSDKTNERKRGFFIAKPKAMTNHQVDRWEVVIDADLERRLHNWRSVVLFGRGASGSCCASWAAAYIAQRDLEMIKSVASLMTINEFETLAAGGLKPSTDQLDGWLIEQAVRLITLEDQRMVLRAKFVWQHNWDEISRKLRVYNRRANKAVAHVVLCKALSSLQDALAQIKSDARIRSYNLHTWSVPCPEAQAVPLGTPAPKEN